MLLNIIFNKKAYYLDKANHYVKSNDHENAVSFFRKYLEIAPGDASILKEIGNQCVEDRNHQNAIRYLSLYLDFRPNDASVLKDRAVQYYMCDENTKAISDLDLSRSLQQSQKRIKKDALLYASRAQTYMFLGEYQKALEDIESAINFEPRYSWLYNTKADIYDRLNMVDAAKKERAKADAVSAESNAAVENSKVDKILQKIELSSYDEASATVETALLEYPDNLSLLFRLADISINESYRFYPSREFDSSYLRAAHQLLTKSVSTLEKILKADPDYPEAGKKLEMARKTLNEIIKLMQ